ncbi:unnamed protein product [Mesocestoides corti]|uniref:OTU domain-containing protein n=1 Tax=Mesocestoides corti TaxID=53468 RepID=A0A0R3U423_MESCO|nr:unnamed protein product [Mesocestoides corti]
MGWRSSRRRTRRRSSSSSTTTDSSSTTTTATTTSTTSTQASKSSEDTQKFRDELSKMGLCLREVPADGNCLFSAFSDQLTGTFSKHAELRAQAVEFLRENRKEMRPFTHTRHFSAMLSDLAENGTYGDHTSIAALARVHRVNVVVHQVGQAPRLVALGSVSPHVCHSHPQVHLAFHEDIAHYSSVRRLDGPSGGPAHVHIDLMRLEKKAANFQKRHRRCRRN